MEDNMKKKLLLMLFLIALVGCSNQPAKASREEAQVEAEESTKEGMVEETKEESPKPSMKEKKDIICYIT